MYLMLISTIRITHLSKSLLFHSSLSITIDLYRPSIFPNNVLDTKPISIQIRRFTYRLRTLLVK